MLPLVYMLALRRPCLLPRDSQKISNVYQVSPSVLLYELFLSVAPFAFVVQLQGVRISRSAKEYKANFWNQKETS